MVARCGSQRVAWASLGRSNFHRSPLPLTNVPAAKSARTMSGVMVDLSDRSQASGTDIPVGWVAAEAALADPGFAGGALADAAAVERLVVVPEPWLTDRSRFLSLEIIG
jgi:hypothetical protein